MYTRRILLSRLKEWAHSDQKLPIAKEILKDPNMPALPTCYETLVIYRSFLKAQGSINVLLYIMRNKRSKLFKKRLVYVTSKSLCRNKIINCICIKYFVYETIVNF